MWTPWTLTRFIRWRVRDLASCFLACKFPLESETCPSSSSPLQMRNMVFETKDERRDQTRSKNETNLNNDSNGIENSSWRRFSDEEYIIFCFKEDGDFDVVKDYSQYDELSNKSPKLNYVEVAESDMQISDEGRTNEDGNDVGEIIAAKEVELGSGRSRRRRQAKERPKRGTISIESSDSNQSDGSNGSFAFPVLGWEWMGSPVQMPKSESLNPKKNKAISVGFQCLRF